MPHLTGLSCMYCLMVRGFLLGIMPSSRLSFLAVVAAKEKKHSFEHGTHFVNLVELVHGLFCLIDQVQEAPEGDEAVMLHDFPETRGA